MLACYAMYVGSVKRTPLYCIYKSKGIWHASVLYQSNLIDRRWFISGLVKKRRRGGQRSLLVNPFSDLIQSFRRTAHQRSSPERLLIGRRCGILVHIVLVILVRVDWTVIVVWRTDRVMDGLCTREHQLSGSIRLLIKGNY